MISVSMRWKVSSDHRLVSKNGLAMRLCMTMSPGSTWARGSICARSEPCRMFCSESGVLVRVPQTPASSAESRYAT